MAVQHTLSIDATLELLLRGAAAVLNCGSASLLLVNEPAGHVRIRVGTLSTSDPALQQVEAIVGSTSGLTVPVALARDSLVMMAWRRRELVEASSLAELVGAALPRAVVAAMDEVVGPRRFICVPALSAARNFGVLLFERRDLRPFAPGQRELLLRYASRIAAVLENDVRERRDPKESQENEPFRAELLRLVSDDLTPTFLVDPAGRIVACNSAAEWTTGLPAADLHERPLAALFVDADAVARRVLGPLGLDDPGGLAEAFALRRAEGRVAAVALSALLLMDDRGASQGLLVQFLAAEPAASLTAGRAVQEQALRRERLATLGELAAQLAHEVRNPLVAIGAALDELAGDYAHEPRLAAELALLNREIVRVDLILRDYLTMAGRHRLTLARVELGTLMADCAHLARAHRRAEQRTLQLDCPPGLVLRADPESLRQILFNLWLNAFEAVPPGGLVECRATRAHDTVRFEVADRGSGPPPGDPFEPFYTTKVNGTGLGLTVCRRLIEAHGGRIALSARVGGGTLVEVWLPVGNVEDWPA